MKKVKDNTKTYFNELKKRGKSSRVHKLHQLVGLEIADILEDRKHKSLYIKLAKDGSPQKLLELAKSVAERKNVKNKGGYFMRILRSNRE